MKIYFNSEKLEVFSSKFIIRFFEFLQSNDINIINTVKFVRIEKVDHLNSKAEITINSGQKCYLILVHYANDLCCSNWEIIKGQNTKIKPPLGLMPKKLHEEQVKSERLKQVRDAISRYYVEGLKINIEWIEEYNELVEYLKIF